MKDLTATQVNALRKPGFRRVSTTLYMSVQKSGSRSWIQRVLIDGRRHDIGLGTYPVVTLRMARDKATENRRAIDQGRNPLLEKRRGKIPTFRVAAEKVHEALAPSFKSAQHTKDWIRILRKHANPKLGNIPVDRLTRQDILAALKPIWTTKPETARRVRQRIRTVLDHCHAEGHVQGNVAGNLIDKALPSMPKVKENFRALDFREMPDAITRIQSKVGSLPARLCLQFLVFTATRSNEAREASWQEIDFEAATWIIPGNRMKNGKPHRVALSASAMAVLEQAKPLRNKSDLIFPSSLRPRQPMTSATLVKALKQIDLAEKTTVHGFRTSFRTWAAERTDIPREVCEMALAHTVGNGVEQAYSRSDLLEKRKSLMQQWDFYLSGE